MSRMLHTRPFTRGDSGRDSKRSPFSTRFSGGSSSSSLFPPFSPPPAPVLESHLSSGSKENLLAVRFARNTRARVLTPIHFAFVARATLVVRRSREHVIFALAARALRRVAPVALSKNTRLSIRFEIRA